LQNSILYFMCGSVVTVVIFLKSTERKNTMSENLISQTTPETPATTSEESIIDQWCDLKEERASAHISKEEAEIIIKKEVEARVAEIEDGYLEQIAGLKRELEALKKK